MAEAGGGAAAGGVPALTVIESEIVATSLVKVEQAIEAIHAARRECRVLPEYKTEEGQDQELKDLKEKDKDLRGMLRDLITQAQARAAVGEDDWFVCFPHTLL
jgi:hypothetical protein